jgi:hypothetical protein
VSDIGLPPAVGLDLLEPGQLVAGLLLATTALGTRRTEVLEEIMKPLEANEILSRDGLVSIFLVVSRAHEEKVTNLVKNLRSGYFATRRALAGERVAPQTQTYY